MDGFGDNVMRTVPTLLTAIVAALLSAGSQAAQLPLTWRWSNPTPHGNNLSDMIFRDGYLIQIGERGQIYSTGDLVSWIPGGGRTTNSLRAITTFGSQIVIVGEAGTVLHGNSISSLQTVNLNTVDWLEGVAASPALLVAVGDAAAIYTSTDAVNWQRETPGFANWLRGVAYGTPPGSGLFVAVGENGTIASSTDGRTWTKRISPTTKSLNRIIWQASQFWVMGDGGAVATSTTGTTGWQLVSTGATNILNTMTVANSATIVAGSSELRLREGSGAWSSQLSSPLALPAPAWTYLSSVWDGSNFLVGGRTGMLVEGFKTNASAGTTSWLPVTDPPREWLWDVNSFANLSIAVGDRGTIMTSVDGVEWDVELPPESAKQSIFLGVGGTPHLALAVGNKGAIAYSRANPTGATGANPTNSLAIFWNAVSPPPTPNDLQGVAASSNLFVVTGGQGTILTSIDGASWKRRATTTTNFLSSVESFPGGWVATGDRGSVLTSSDGLSWTTQAAPTTNWIYRVRYLSGKLVAVGQNGTILTSDNGIAWKSRVSGTTQWLTGVAQAGDAYFAVGTQGTVLMSTNIFTWTNLGTITQKSFYGAVANGSQLLLVGVEGVILRTRTEPIPTPIRFVDFPHGAADNLFLFTGKTDQRFTLDRSTNLVNWTTGPALEITEPNGILFYLDSTTNASPNQFYRARLLP